MTLRLLAALALAGAAHAPALSAPEFTPLRPETHVLGNGLEVHVIPDRGSGLVHLQLRLPAGVAAEPAGLEGVSALTTQLLTAGTTLRNADRINEDLIRLGTTVEAATGPEYATVGATFLATDVDEGVALIADLVTHPLILEEDFRRLHRIAVARAYQPTVPGAVAQDLAVAGALPRVPAARPPFGTLEGLRRLRREDVRAFHRDRYRPGGSALVFSGDITPARARALADEWFAGWSGSAAATPAPSAPDTALRSPVRILDAALPAAEIRIAYAVPGRAAADRVAREFAAELFQRDLSARRSRWSSALTLFQERGAWVLSASVPVDSAAAEVRRIRRELADFASRPRPLATVRGGARLVRAFHPLGFETVSQRAARWLAAEFAGDSAGALAALPARIARLSPADVQTAAARGLDLARPVIVVAGPAARLQPVLAAFGDVAIHDPLRDERRGLENATAEELRRGRNLIGQAQAALGGEARLREVTDTVVEAELTLTVRGETVRGRLRQVRKDPDRLKLVTIFGRRQTFQVLNGREAWSVLPGDTALRVGDSTEVANLAATYRADPLRLLRAASDSASRAIHRGRDLFEGREAERVDVVFADGVARRLWLDPVSRRPLAIETVDFARPSLTPTRWTFADYRQVQGIWWPHEERRLVGGEPYMELKTVSVQFNAGVRDEEFQAPASAPRAPGR